jgi:hypothetical protein
MQLISSKSQLILCLSLFGGLANSMNYQGNPTLMKNMLVRDLVCYGAVPSSWGRIDMIAFKLHTVFPEPLLQAVVKDDLIEAKRLLAHAPSGQVVKDRWGRSALVYAAGRGNQELVDALLMRSAYREDTRGIENAVRAVKLRLDTIIDNNSVTYNKYQEILEKLKKSDELSYRTEKFLELSRIAKDAWQEFIEP